MSAPRRLLLGAAAALLAAPALAAEPVDVALVLAADASGSIDADEYRLQKEGVAEAVADARVLAGIRSGPLGRITLAYVEWGAPGGAATMVPWMAVSGAASAASFGSAVLAAPRSVQSWNAIGDAIDHCAGLLAACPYEATRQVIDISGDAGDMRSLRPAPVARDAAVAKGIVINALAIVEGRSGLVAHYEGYVIGGPGAFVEVAPTRAEFTAALRRKIIREIA
jgi:hypothetical protein